VIVDTDARNPADYSKRERTRLAKAEVWMQLATTAQRWSDEVANAPTARTIPFAKWPADDPRVELAARYGLSAADLAKLLASVADQVETKAMAAGYEETWDD
jgi:hypothetical protein